MMNPYSRCSLTGFGYVLALVCLLLGGPDAGAQSVDFVPVREDSNQLVRLLGQYQEQYNKELTALPSNNKKDYQEIYGRRWDHIKGLFDKKEIYTSRAAQQYLDALVAEIRKANPVLQQRSFQCYFSRTWIPNAGYVGEGIILFNMGLFQRLDNESQAAFVIGHEIGHYLLGHQDSSMNKYVVTINSPEVQAELRKIKGSEFRKREQLEHLVKGMTFDSRRHSRDHESQADSMAVELMRATRYDLSGALSALALLDIIDTDSLDMKRCLSASFNSKGYPFKDSWLTQEDGLLGGHARLEKDGMEDSLKTHPDCQTRIGLLKPLVDKYTVSGKSLFVVDKDQFQKYRVLFSYESNEYAYEVGNYTRGLFLSLQGLQRNPSDVWFVVQTGKLLNGIYAAQKGHRLSKVVDLPAPYYPADYNLLLQFIQNLYVEDIAGISYNYLLGYRGKLDGYIPFREVYHQSEKNNQ